MKIIIFILSFFLVTFACHSQLLKKIADDVKNEAEWKVRVKARQKTNEALDSLLAVPNKSEKKSKSKKSEKNQTNSEKQTSSESNSENEETMGEGFIKLSVSATEVFKGSTVVITGESVKYNSLEKVKLVITGKAGKDMEEEKELKLYENGSFAAGWNAEKAGDFIITVKSSDGKDQKSVKVKVYDIEVMDDLWVHNNIEITHKTYDKLKQDAARIEESLSAKDKAELAKKMMELKTKVDVALKLFIDLKTAANKLASVTGKNPLPKNLSDNLSQLNEQLAKQGTEMEQLYNAADHKPYDNTICEYLVMMNETLAALQTINNFWSKSITTILKNIAFDKAIPKQIEVINQSTVQAGPTQEFITKESTKIFAMLQDDAKALESVTAKAEIGVDIAQFLTEVLLKSYCGVFKGEVSEHYEITYRNRDKAIWWEYSYDTKAVVTFRYPKSNSGNVIKLKGNIEGNATKFNFKQDVEKMDDFRDKMQGRTKLIPKEVWTPLGVPFATSQADVVGFGALARGLATPSYFNIPVDGEYNVDQGTIKLLINDPIIDFTPAVQYVYVFIGIPAGLPVITRVHFPINKVKPTLNAVVSKSEDLKVTKDSKNNLIIKGNGERKIGSSESEIEHKITYTLNAKNEN